MYLTGHTGLTLGVVTLLQSKKRPMSNRKIGVVMGFSLMPDILDRLLHIVVRGYPDHGVFHSVFFYALAVSLVFLFMRRALPYISIMAMHILFDLVNVNPRAFLYPPLRMAEAGLQRGKTTFPQL
jgi:LexA-binding, inner membrane-associated putative hydrolase